MNAPIAIFVYNRPSHTKSVLDNLSLNKQAKNSELFVFCDGLKQNSTDVIKTAVQETRSLIESENRFKKVTIYKHQENQGLAKSIIFGVSKVLSQYDKIIVLEDDIVPEKGFLGYMNEALNIYCDNDEVGCVHAWNYTFNKNMISDSTFFLKGADCWGWGTWKNAWDLLELDGRLLLNQIKTKNLDFEFNRNNTHSFTKMLEDQIEGKNNSWAIRWHASLFLANKYCLHPKYPIVKNIGLDGTGTHSGVELLLQKTVKKIKIKKKDTPKENLFFYKSFEMGIKSNLNLWENLKKKFGY